MAVIDNAYNYYIQTYGESFTQTRFDTHKKSDLRNVYNSILKVNKESPLYKLVDPIQAQKFAIDIKESSRNIQTTLSAIDEDFDEDGGNFKKKVPYSTDDSRIEVDYVGKDPSSSSSGAMEIEVESLARPQINTSNFLANDGLAIAPGEYTFDLTTNQTAFTFEFNVNPGDNNYDVNSRLANLINNAKLGLNAQVIEDDRERSAVEISSEQTGLTQNEEYLFDISSDGSAASNVIMGIFGLDRVTQEAANSSFYINGSPHSSYSNNFTINKEFELTLKDTTRYGPITIGFKSDAEAIADNVTRMADAYNSMVDVANRYSGINIEMNKLGNILGGIKQRFEDELTPLGLEFGEDGKISVDRALLTDAASESNWADAGDRLNRFKNTVSNLAVRTSLNPIDFVDKKICAYKNPGHNFTAPYATSLYAGMLFSAAR